MRSSKLRIPYTDVLAAPTIIPSSATTVPSALAALRNFFNAEAQSPSSSPASGGGRLPGLGQHLTTGARSPPTVVLTGAGISVASGLADYRGVKGTYRVNKTYRPIYHHEFLQSHEARKRYWARSFLGWTTLHKARPNATHFAVKHLGDMGLVDTVITQNVDSFHPMAHPQLPTVELHGYLRATVCTSCFEELPRNVFQDELARLNPAWAAFLEEIMATGALDTEDPEERKAKGMRANPDGDVDVPNAPYTTFRYPPCPRCLSSPPVLADGSRATVEADTDGGWKTTSNAGVLKPAVTMFGENVRPVAKSAAEQAIEGAGRVLVLGTSLATYSAWRLVKRAQDRGVPIAIINIGGVRGENAFFTKLDPGQNGKQGVRLEISTDDLLPALVEELRLVRSGTTSQEHGDHSVEAHGASVFKDMMS
ncbi:NAD+-dependent protein deacetylase sirtuin 4 [Microdochium nivale]|nr:NAD+-dependent protein deacetylase sirtuin 4 [Microdochium nivale]